MRYLDSRMRYLDSAPEALRAEFGKDLNGPPFILVLGPQNLQLPLVSVPQNQNAINRSSKPWP